LPVEGATLAPTNFDRSEAEQKSPCSKLQGLNKLKEDNMKPLALKDLRFEHDMCDNNERKPFLQGKGVKIFRCPATVKS
jgi:hypothetical protein